LNIGVVVVYHFRDGEMEIHLLGHVESEAQVLAHPVNGKSKIVVTLRNRPRTVIHLPRLSRTALDSECHLIDIQAGAFRKVEGLR
jgi:hypothetical protein